MINHESTKRKLSSSDPIDVFIISPDPVDVFVNEWNERSEEIKKIPIPPEKQIVYFKDLEERIWSFKHGISFFDPADGFQKVPDYGFFKFASLEEIFDHEKKSKYSYNEVRQKLDALTTSFHFAVNQGIEKYQENERKHQEEMTKNKRGFFDNAKVSFLTFIGINK